MKVRIVLSPQNSGWVIGKMATRLANELRQLGIDAELAATPDPLATVNHWMSFAFAPGVDGSINTMFVTHVDDPYKVGLIKDRLQSTIDMALCMSPHARQELIELGVPAQKIWHVLPALDAAITPRRIRIGITTRLYDDGRKREKLLIQLSREMRLDQFVFEIFGAGWEDIIPMLKSAGAEVIYDPGSDDWQGDYSRIVAAVRNFDYYLYLGMDEGSLGTLDAHSAGIKTIVTAQGFHLAIPGGITYPFTEYQELKLIFADIAAKSIKAGARLEQWNWRNYAREHALIWQAMASDPNRIVPEEILHTITCRGVNTSAQGFESKLPAKHRINFYLRMLSPRRILGAIARHRFMRPLRSKLGR